MDKETARFFEERPEIIAVYLFESRPRFRAKETSNVDLAILLNPLDIYRTVNKILIVRRRL